MVISGSYTEFIPLSLSSVVVCRGSVLSLIMWRGVCTVLLLGSRSDVLYIINVVICTAVPINSVSGCQDERQFWWDLETRSEVA